MSQVDKTSQIKGMIVMPHYIAHVMLRADVPTLRTEDFSTTIETDADDEIQARRHIIHEVRRSKYIVSDILDIAQTEKRTKP